MWRERPTRVPASGWVCLSFEFRFCFLESFPVARESDSMGTNAT